MRIHLVIPSNCPDDGFQPLADNDNYGNLKMLNRNIFLTLVFFFLCLAIGAAIWQLFPYNNPLIYRMSPFRTPTFKSFTGHYLPRGHQNQPTIDQPEYSYSATSHPASLAIQPCTNSYTSHISRSWRYFHLRSGWG